VNKVEYKTANILHVTLTREEIQISKKCYFYGPACSAYTKRGTYRI